MTEQVATLAGGCFWCIEAVFADLKGVSRVVSGYTGGHVDNPTYEQVCGKQTGHAEAIEVRFDPEVISYETLLDVFFHVHDPTTLNRQGNDVGPQYRSAIFTHDAAQQAAAQAAITRASQDWPDPIVTELAPAQTFWPAEAYHQDYFAQNGGANPYCAMVVAPKLAKFRKTYAALLKG